MAKSTRRDGVVMTDAVARAAASAAGGAVNPDKLAALRAKIAEARDLGEQIEEATARLDELTKSLWRVRSEELPAMFEELGVTSMTLEASGNHAACLAKLTTQYSATLPQDERRALAFKKFRWLGELAKNAFTVQLGRDDAAKAKKVAAALKKLKVPFDQKVSVHGGTLTAEIRRRFEDGQPLPPADLDILGAFVRPIVKIDEPKEKK